MTGAVTSIAGARRAARARSENHQMVTRLSVMLLIAVALLAIVGLGALLSASSVISLRETGSDNLFYFKRQLLWGLIAITGMIITIRIPYRIYARFAVPIFLTAVGGLLLVLAFGVVRGGARRWLLVGSISVQPSEFAKFAVVVFVAMVLSRREHVMHSFGRFFWPVAGSVGLVGALVMMEPDLGTVLLIAVAATAVMVASAVPMRWVIGTTLLGSAAALALAASADYRRARLVAFLDPFADHLGTGFQAVQSLVALGSGGWFGVGLGLSRARWSFLPNAHTDFIFAIIGEETGLAGSAAVVGLFVLFSVVGTLIALRAPDRFGRLLAVGIVTWLSAQALMNIGGTVGLLPITGIPLPFISFGGTALIADFVAVGVLLNIARSAVPPR